MVILGGAGSLPGRSPAPSSSMSCWRLRPQTPISDWTNTDAGSFYGPVLLILVAKLRPWRRLAAILGGVVAFGLVVNAIVAVTTADGTAGPGQHGRGGFSADGWFGMALRHWLVLPARHLRGGDDGTVQHRARRADRSRARRSRSCAGGSATCCSCRRSGSQASSGRRASCKRLRPTRLLLLGVILIVVMVARPQGLFGQAARGDRLSGRAAAPAQRRGQGVRRPAGASASSTSRSTRARS